MKFSKVIKATGLVIIGIVLNIILFLIAGLFINNMIVKTPPFLNESGKVIENSIALLEKVKLGGYKQTILIRGKNKNNPILLYLHGGPGSSELPLVRHFNSRLEDYFIVVNWDQRGTCKSFSPFIDKKTMIIDNFMSDTYELVNILRKRFNKDKIYLVGHSWGSFLGLKTVYKHPELFYAYVGIGQAINFKEGEKISLKFTIEKAKELNNKEALKELLSLKEYPSVDDKFMKNVLIQRKWLGKFGGVLFGEKGMESLFKIKRPPEFTLFDFIPFGFGSLYSLPLLFPDLIKQEDFRVSAPKLKVPVYFITGKHDFCVPFKLTESYYKMVRAPKKELIWFEKSAHMPNFEEPDKFNDIMIKKVLFETYLENKMGSK